MRRKDSHWGYPMFANIASIQDLQSTIVNCEVDVMMPSHCAKFLNALTKFLSVGKQNTSLDMLYIVTVENMVQKKRYDELSVNK